MNHITQLMEGFKIFLQYPGEDGECTFHHDEILAGNKNQALKRK